MAQKKDFTADAAGVFVEKMITPTTPAQKQTKPAPRRNTAARIVEAIAGTAKVEEERVTMIIDKEATEKLRAVAWQDKRKFKDVVTEAMHMYIDKYEAEHGTIKTR